MWGTCETAGAMLWRIVRKELPSCKIVVVRRPVIEVQRSLARVGAMSSIAALAEEDAMLEAAIRDPEIMPIHYQQLGDPQIGKLLFEHCLEIDFDFEWWTKMVQMNVQVDMPAWLRKMEERRPAFRQLVEEVRNRGEGMTIRYVN
jgi:hypothetical protein